MFAYLLVIGQNQRCAKTRVALVSSVLPGRGLVVSGLAGVSQAN